MQRPSAQSLENGAAPGCLALLWILPLAYALWAAFHPSAYSAHFVLTAPLTLDNFVARLERGAVRALFPQHRSCSSR